MGNFREPPQSEVRWATPLRPYLLPAARVLPEQGRVVLLGGLHDALLGGPWR